MTQGTNNIWKAGRIINAGEGANEFVSLIRKPAPSTPTPPTDAYAVADRPSHVISQGDRERPSNPVLAGNPLRKPPIA